MIIIIIIITLMFLMSSSESLYTISHVIFDIGLDWE